MAYKVQKEKEIMLKRSRKYAFKHKRTGEIDGFEDIDIAKTVVLSPSWEPISDEAKKLYAKLTKKESK
jgi:hypothetical protein